MAYTTALNASMISGSTQAKQIDNDLRALRTSLIERFNDKIVVDATADPWVLLDTITGKKLSKTLVIPFNHFTTAGGGSTIISVDNVKSDAAAGPLLAGFVLPNGVTIVGAVALINPATLSGGSVEMELYKVTGTVPFTKVSLAAWTVTATGQQVSANGTTLGEVTDGSATYYLSIDIAGSSATRFVTVYGARIIYNTPTHQNTI